MIKKSQGTLNIPKDEISQYNAREKFVHSVDKLISCRVKINHESADITEYKKLSEDIGDLYVDETLRKQLTDLYMRVYSSRKELCKSDCVDFVSPDSVFLLRLINYLESIKTFFRTLFCGRTEYSSDIVCRSVLEQIIYSDMETVSAGMYYEAGAKTIRIKLGNPLILESLYIARLQYTELEKFNDEHNAKEDDTLRDFYQEIWESQVYRLFKDTVILYEGEFYKIIGVDDDALQFIARREEDLCSIGQVPAFRLYEKIILGLEKKRDESDVKCLIVGDVPNEDKKFLKNMIEEWRSERCAQFDISLEYADKREDIHNTISNRSVFESCIDEYDKIFVLDCPEIYGRTHLDTMVDDYGVTMGTSSVITKFLAAYTTEDSRGFYRQNRFTTLYYRVQNYLVNPEVNNGRRARRINKGFLDYLNDMFKCDELGQIGRQELKGKEVYIYFSDEEVFEDDVYDSYNFLRDEMFNLKKYRVIRFSDRQDAPVFESQNKTLETTFYDVLKTLSDPGRFYCRMTGESGDDADMGNIFTAIRIAQITKIHLDYGNISVIEENKARIDISIRFTIYAGHLRTGDRLDRYMKVLCPLMTEMFDSHGDDTQNEPAVTRERILLYESVQRFFADVICASSKNFDDLLFHHIYSKLFKGSVIDFEFNVDSKLRLKLVRGEARVSESDGELTNYFYKRVAETLMSDLDGKTYRETNIASHIRMASANNERITFYSQNIKEACRNLGYTVSPLYSRLNKYYNF